jgi:hypothetical protein
MTTTLTITLIVRNEEQTLGRCLDSVRGLADEIVVVDTGSTDATRQIATERRARVVEFPWCDDFAAARNESLRQATGRWVLWLDADEYCPFPDHLASRRRVPTLPRRPRKSCQPTGSFQNCPLKVAPTLPLFKIRDSEVKS